MFGYFSVDTSYIFELSYVSESVYYTNEHFAQSDSLSTRPWRGLANVHGSWWVFYDSKFSPYQCYIHVVASPAVKKTQTTTFILAHFFVVAKESSLLDVVSSSQRKDKSDDSFDHTLCIFSKLHF